jgi:hypothetical protein
MMDILEALDRLLAEAEKSSMMENASFGFPDDRVEVKSVHFGCDDKGRVGDVMHPDEYVKNITRLYRQSWVTRPIREARELLKLHSDIIRDLEEMRDQIHSSDLLRTIERLSDRVKSSISA